MTSLAWLPLPISSSTSTIHVKLLKSPISTWISVVPSERFNQARTQSTKKLFLRTIKFTLCPLEHQLWFPLWLHFKYQCQLAFKELSQMSLVIECLIMAIISIKFHSGFLSRQVIYFNYNFSLINRGFSSDLEGVRTWIGSVQWSLVNDKLACACLTNAGLTFSPPEFRARPCNVTGWESSRSWHTHTYFKRKCVLWQKVHSLHEV